MSNALKIGVCGHYGGDKKFNDGQTVKTKTLTDEITRIVGGSCVYTVDTYGWKGRMITLFVRCVFLMKTCDVVIILPAQNGVRVLIPFYILLNKIFHRKLLYIVVGAWLPSLLKQKPGLKYYLNKFHGIYAETMCMLEKLHTEGLNNSVYLPNFKNLEILERDNLVYTHTKPYKLCTFSRVMREKGIEHAIQVVKRINESFGMTIYTLDIYGPIDPKYTERFQELQDTFPPYISYRGVVDFNNSVNTLKDYFALLFPTLFRTEGMPGTIIDSFAAGVPVIASNWDSANEVIDDSTGLRYPFGDVVGLENVLVKVSEAPTIVLRLKNNCLLKARDYMPEKCVQFLISSMS